jgi:hypothetical protein
MPIEVVSYKTPSSPPPASNLPIESDYAAVAIIIILISAYAYIKRTKKINHAFSFLFYKPY